MSQCRVCVSTPVSISWGIDAFIRQQLLQHTRAGFTKAVVTTRKKYDTIRECLEAQKKTARTSCHALHIPARHIRTHQTEDAERAYVFEKMYEPQGHSERMNGRVPSMAPGQKWRCVRRPMVLFTTTRYCRQPTDPGFSSGLLYLHAYHTHMKLCHTHCPGKIWWFRMLQTQLDL